jgi:hypothetical protein
MSVETRAPVFARTPQGVEIASEWPAETLATREFIENAEPQWMQRRGRLLSFTLLNGSAAYRIAARGNLPRTYLLRRVA